MSQKPSRLSVPARKFYIGQLLKCSRSENEDLDSNQGNWKYMTSELSLVFNQVWIQGEVISATKDRSDVIVDDGTGIVLLTGINRIIKDVKFCEGMYVMAAGELQSVDISPEKPYPVIRVLKVANLSQSLCAEALWMLEVIDAQLHVKEAAGMI